jgi:predicted 2-oxoglutarate/Fe(II)-dependent dioxygenase YbiX
MDNNLKSYLKIYRRFIDHKICDASVLELESADWKQHKFYDPVLEEYSPKSGLQELEMARKNISTQLHLMEQIHKGFLKYVTDLDFSWFNSWAGYTEVRYNRYQQNSLMAEHCDHINDIFDGTRKGVPTMTALGLLNDGFIGGDFIMWTDQKIPLSKGDLIIFPSNFLFPHRVDPVISGTRYTFISWAW